MTMTLIQTITLGADASSIEFASIPQTYTDLMLVASIRTARAVVADDLAFRFNGDTGSNYLYRSIYGTGNATASGTGTLTGGYLGLYCGSSATANTFGNGSLYIPNYTGATSKPSSCETVTENNGTVSHQIIIANSWTQTSAITSITIYNFVVANLVAGTKISLYGILKGSDGIVTVS
jgi:hypothetical protein